MQSRWTFLRFIDLTSEWVGKVVSFIILFMVGAIIWDVVLRYAFRARPVWGLEAYGKVFLVYITCGAAYALITRAFINVDILYRRFPLRTRGIIDQFTAVLNPAKLGRPTLALILITIRYRVPGSRKVISQREFCEEIAQHPLVQEVHVLSGEFDVLLNVRAKDVQEMNNFIVDSLREMPAVDRTLTMFAMDTYLDTLMLRNLQKG